MDHEPHRPSCAKQLRETGLRRGEPVQEIARIIHAHCAVSLLRAHRLARGLTLKTAAGALNALAVQAGWRKAPRVSDEQLRLWETGSHQPRRATVQLLCDLYETTPHDLALGTAAPQPISAAPAAPGQSLPARTSLHEPQAVGSLQHVDEARRSVDRTLSIGTVSANQLDLLGEQVLWARERYVYTPPAPMLTVLLAHLEEVRRLAEHRQPAVVQVRLSELTAVLATLVADALMKLGQLTRSQAWYATARDAADDSGNTHLRARVRAQAAMLPYYYGPIEAAVALSTEARIICRNRPSATAAFAAAAEARALARLGDTRDAEVALQRAVTLFEATATGGQNDAFAFPERRFRLYESGTLTALGRTRQAREAQEAALRLYPEKTGIDPALLRLETALCLAHDRSPTEACQLAGMTLLRVDPEHHTPILVERAREVIGALPPAARTGSAATDLREILALPRS
ncbi:helix-turn-helix domain-containing protein [Streptomyces sp. NPDC002476]|uniref:helix-turn-helix domain-containing protein n=1 Tax=Streptomyces sp. NPDC002476 TaxID=3364648 RepID=UPI0036B77A61